MTFTFLQVSSYDKPFHVSDGINKIEVNILYQGHSSPIDDELATYKNFMLFFLDLTETERYKLLHINIGDVLYFTKFNELNSNYAVTTLYYNGYLLVFIKLKNYHLIDIVSRVMGA